MTTVEISVNLVVEITDCTARREIVAEISDQLMALIILTRTKYVDLCKNDNCDNVKIDTSAVCQANQRRRRDTSSSGVVKVTVADVK